MKKKIISAMLAATMVLSVSAQAATNLADFFATNSKDELNTTKIETPVSVKVKTSSATDYASHATKSNALISYKNNNAFDYETTLDMSGVKKAFTEYKGLAKAFIAGAGADAKAEQIDTSEVTGEFTVTIAYDTELAHSVTAADIVLKQGTDVFVFDEAASKLDVNPAELKFTVKDGATVTELEADDCKALGDISLELKGFTAQANDKYLEVKVTLDGYTKLWDGTNGDKKEYAKITFATSEAAADNAAYVIVKTSTGGGGSLGTVTAPKAYTVVDGDKNEIKVTTKNDVTTVDLGIVADPEKEGYTFGGWYLDEELTKPADKVMTIKKDTYYYAKFTPVGEVNLYTVVDGTETKQELTDEDGKKTFDVSSLEDPKKDGYSFNGWYTTPYYTEKAEGVLEIVEDTYLYAQFVNTSTPGKLNSDEHMSYIAGYPDGTVKPNNNITREEVVAAFYRLLDENYRTEVESDENGFADVEKERWSNVSISSMANAGIVVGDTLGKFNPASPITRAEFAVIASKFANAETEASSNIFSDIDEHWGKDAILTAVAHGWITGYEDGTFKPDAKITRAEAMTIINKMLVRYADTDSELATEWPDVNESDWFYGAVIEATTSHTFTRSENGWTETWTGLVK